MDFIFSRRIHLNPSLLHSWRQGVNVIFLFTLPFFWVLFRKHFTFFFIWEICLFVLFYFSSNQIHFLFLFRQNVPPSFFRSFIFFSVPFSCFLLLHLVFCSSILFSVPPSYFLFLHLVFCSFMLFSVPLSCFLFLHLVYAPNLDFGSFNLSSTSMLFSFVYLVPLFFSSILFSVPLFCFYPSCFLVLHLVLGTFIHI